MSRKKRDHRMRPGPRPRTIGQVNRHMDRRRVRQHLRGYRYLRMPSLSMPDVAVGAGLGFGVLAMVLTIAGLVG